MKQRRGREDSLPQEANGHSLIPNNVRIPVHPVGNHRKQYTDANGQIKINKGFSENLTDPVFPLFSAIYVRHWMRRGMGRLRDGSVRDD